MKVLFLFFIVIIVFPNTTLGQHQKRISTKKIDVENNLKIINHIILQLENKKNWNKQSKFGEECDLGTSQQTLGCAIKKAQIEIIGVYKHRSRLMKMIRHKIQKHFFFRQGFHPIDGFNKNKRTSHKEILFLLNAVKTQLLERENT